LVNTISGKNYFELNNSLAIGAIKESSSPQNNYFSYNGELGLEFELFKNWSLTGGVIL